MINLVNKKENIYNDNVGFVELYDVSQGNKDFESRIDVVSTIASVCFGNDKAKNPEKLFNRLISESMGLPSSSFEFILVLLKPEEYTYFTTLAQNFLNKYKKVYQLHIMKYGKFIWSDRDNNFLLLTNYRALVNDFNKLKEFGFGKDLTQIFNNDDYEIDLIRRHYVVFKMSVPIFVARQIMRHRDCEWQEISRRYTSNKKAPFSFYIADKLRDISLRYKGVDLTVDDILNIVEGFYNESLKQGVRAEIARTVLPINLYTTIWMGGFRDYFEEHFIPLRTDKHTQEQTRVLAENMKELLKG